MRTQIIIPARLAARRLPGKPLALLAGVPLVIHVARQAGRAAGAGEVLIATDAPSIAEAAAAHRVAWVMTGAEHASGTDRVAEAAARGDAEAIVNVQGDEPFVHPDDVAAVAAALADGDADVVTLAAPILDLATFRRRSVTKVVCDARGDALYFSRAPIPHPRAAAGAPATVPPEARRHIGVYGFRRAALFAMCAAPPQPLEQREGLEQLRALAIGLRIRVLPAITRGHGIDTPTDLARARRHVARLGAAAFPQRLGQPKAS